MRITQALIRRAVGDAQAKYLVLGATPELGLDSLNTAGSQIAVDRSEAMLRNLRPNRRNDNGQSVQGDWTALPLADQSIDCVLGDGCFTVLEQLEDYHRFCQELQRVLRPGGSAILRIFVRPEIPETVDAVVEDLCRGAIGSFHAFKWRLAMALQTSLSEGVDVQSIWRRWQNLGMTPHELSRRMGWSENSIATMAVYRGASTRYTFPTLAEIRQIVGAYLSERDCIEPSYELGQRCPTLWLMRR